MQLQRREFQRAGCGIWTNVGNGKLALVKYVLAMAFSFGRVRCHCAQIGFGDDSAEEFTPSCSIRRASVRRERCYHGAQILDPGQ